MEQSCYYISHKCLNIGHVRPVESSVLCVRIYDQKTPSKKWHTDILDVFPHITLKSRSRALKIAAIWNLTDSPANVPYRKCWSVGFEGPFRSFHQNGGVQKNLGSIITSVRQLMTTIFKNMGLLLYMRQQRSFTMAKSLLSPKKSALQGSKARSFLVVRFNDIL